MTAIQDQDIHAYFSPYESPYLAFIYLMNAIRDLDHKVRARLDLAAATRSALRAWSVLGSAS